MRTPTQATLTVRGRRFFIFIPNYPGKTPGEAVRVFLNNTAAPALGIKPPKDRNQTTLHL